MSAEPAQNAHQFQEVMDLMEKNHRDAIASTRTGMLKASAQQGIDVSLDQAGNLPVGASPNCSAKDLVHKYGREASPSAERTPERQPEP
jgi:hypothetical protein